MKDVLVLSKKTCLYKGCHTLLEDSHKLVQRFIYNSVSLCGRPELLYQSFGTMPELSRADICTSNLLYVIRLSIAK